MIEILVMQCLLTDIKHCRNVHVPVIEATTVQRCKDLAPIKLYEFGSQYDNLWFIRTWKCQNSETPEEEKL